MRSSRTICIVTPGYIANTPRVVKEADALWQAGFEVRVVCSRGNMELIHAHDEDLLKDKPWRCDTVGWSSFQRDEQFLFHASRLRHNLIRRLPPFAWSIGHLAETGEGRVYPELANLTAAEYADLYIGHYPAGLAAAALAAQRWHTRFSYDVEDLHTGELAAREAGSGQRITIIERRYIPECTYVTAVSDMIADEISLLYAIERPTVIHNVFPLAERENIDGQMKDRQGTALSLYWYSQTIGLIRGIQDTIRAAGCVKKELQIHLRGTVSPEVRETLQALARENGVEKCLYFHPPVPPGELISRAAEHDVGLALEPGFDRNNASTTSNKLFFYLLAGLCVAATDVPGQKRIMQTIPDAGFIYRVGDHDALAAHLNQLLTEPERLKRYKQAALNAAYDTWNWEKESEKLVSIVKKALQCG